MKLLLRKAWPCCANWALQDDDAPRQRNGAVRSRWVIRWVLRARVWPPRRLTSLHATLCGRYALCTMCIGVGQGIAVILEKV